MKTAMIVFDMAGTTVEDSDNVHHALMDAMKKADYIITREDANRVMGYPKPIAIETLLRDKHKVAESKMKQLIEEIYQVFLLDMVHHYRYSPDVKAKPNAEYVFDFMRKKGVKVVLDTGVSRQIADTIIERLNWASLIDYSITSDEVLNGRPFPDMIMKAMKHFDIADTQAVAKVGDTPSDLMEGMNAKCGYVIGVTHGAYTREQLEKEKYTHLVDNLTELLTIVK